jgi:hypothetical protein
MDTNTLIADIPQEAARQAYYGVSMSPERRGDSSRADYAATLAADYATLRAQAEKGGTLSLLDEEFASYRARMRRNTLAYLHSSARCVSWFIAGPSNFPAARMAKRSDIAHKRLNELIEFRSRAMAAIKRRLRPDLRAIYAGDGDALERLEAKVSSAEALQARMKATNATIRRHAKEGPAGQVAALLGMGYQEMTARRLLEPDFCGRIGFADYELTNNGANIRRMKARVEQITRLQNTPGQQLEGSAARMEDCPPENRVRLFFPGKPAVEIRDELKRSGFRWAPSLGCWQAYRKQHTYDTAVRIAGIEKPEPGVQGVLVKAYSKPEVYAGEPTGKTVWRAETSWPQKCKAAEAMQSVLGRGDTAEEALEDWNRRAAADGHNAKAIRGTMTTAAA